MVSFLPVSSAAQCDSGKYVHLPKYVQSHLAESHGKKQTVHVSVPIPLKHIIQSMQTFQGFSEDNQCSF